MDKQTIMNDMKFRQICSEFALNWSSFQIIENMIVIETPRQNVYMLLDEDYNIIDFAEFIYYENFENIKKYYNSYIKPFFEGESSTLNFPFSEFSLKQIHDVSKRIRIKTNHNGWPSEVWINGTYLKNDEKMDQLKIISYIKFIEKIIDNYWKKIYQLKILGLTTPSINVYLKSICERIKNYIEISVYTEKRVSPISVLNYIGELDFKDEGLLYDVIDLYIKSSGYTSKEGSMDELKSIPERDKLSAEYQLTTASRLLNLLSIKYEDIDIEDVKKKELKNS